MYDRRVAAALGENDSIVEEKLWMDISNGEQQLYPRLLFVITGMNFFMKATLTSASMMSSKFQRTH